MNIFVANSTLNYCFEMKCLKITLMINNLAKDYFANIFIFYCEAAAGCVKFAKQV